MMLTQQSKDELQLSLVDVLLHCTYSVLQCADIYSNLFTCWVAMYVIHNKAQIWDDKGSCIEDRLW